MGDFMNDFNLCPNCGSKNIKNVKNRKWLCQDCGFDLYNNVASAVGLIICDKENKILLEERAKEPKKGFLAFPGGFVDPDETAEQACIRECMEEIGAKPAELKYLCSFPNTYEYKNITYKTCDLFFEAILKNVVPFASVGLIAGVISNIAQNKGFIFTLKPLTPDFKKIIPNFSQYFKNTLFSFIISYKFYKSML